MGNLCTAQVISRHRGWLEDERKLILSGKVQLPVLPEPLAYRMM